MTNQRENLAPVVDAAQRVAGLVAARARGDAEGAHQLLLTFSDERELAGGALLLAELSLGMLHRQTGEPLEDCLRELCVDMETALD